jgi:hypothetical protein
MLGSVPRCDIYFRFHQLLSLYPAPVFSDLSLAMSVSSAIAICPDFLTDTPTDSLFVLLPVLALTSSGSCIPSSSNLYLPHCDILKILKRTASRRDSGPPFRLLLSH